MEINKNELFRKLIASWVDYQVIRGNNTAVPDESDFAVLRVLPAERQTANNIRTFDNKEYSSMSVYIVYQLDFYSNNQIKAEDMASNMAERLIFINRNDLIRAGFGLSDYQIDVEDRSLIENSEFIYRYGFDVNVNYKVINERDNTPIQHVNIIIGDENKEI